MASSHAEDILKKNPTAKIMTTQYDFVNEPWKADRLEKVFETIVSKSFQFAEDDDPFHVRKSLLQDEEILSFQRNHPQLYYTLTDRKMMQNETYRGILKSMLLVRKGVENRTIPEGERADAAASQAILSSLTRHEG